MTPTLVNKQHMPFDLDGGSGSRAMIGVIVLATDEALEPEWRSIMQPLDGVAFFESRIENAPTINAETLAQMETRLPQAAALILPGVPLNVVAYGCTSASMVIGPDNVAARIHEVRPGVAVTNPITAGIKAMKALGADRIALLTPYVDDVNQWMRGYIEDNGLAVPVMGSFNHENDVEVARISPASIERAVEELGADPNVDGVFVACTNLRVARIVEGAEKRIGKPVSSSNHAMAWHSLRLAGVQDQFEGFGSLFVSC